MKQKIGLIALFLFISFSTFAHAIWIETNATGNKGKQQEVKVFLGEYSSGKPDSLKNWFSNMRDIKLMLTTPNGNNKILSLTPSTDHYTTNFVPSEDGAYILSITHTVADIYGETKIEYYAAATVQVNSTNFGILPKATLLALKPSKAQYHINQSIGIQVWYEQKPLAAAKVVIDAPFGWSKTVDTDTSGNSKFTPLIPGKYMIEAIKNDKAIGSHFGKAYKTISHIVTYCIQVQP